MNERSGVNHSSRQYIQSMMIKSTPFAIIGGLPGLLLLGKPEWTVNCFDLVNTSLKNTRSAFYVLTHIHVTKMVAIHSD